jgi:hypothetical protein
VDLQQFQHSTRVYAQYVNALATLSEQLNETWKRVLPPDARWPRETCEAFFEPFAQLGVALYAAYAPHLLDSKPSHGLYVEALKSDLKTLVCNQICPYREKPIRTLQDALDAGARGEQPDEWATRIGESWRLFQHPRHSAIDAQVRREFIDLYGYMPELWGQLFGYVHTAISRRTIHWISAHAAIAEADTIQPANVEVEHGAALASTPAPGNRQKRPSPEAAVSAPRVHPSREAFLRPHLVKRTRNAIADAADISSSSLQRWHEGKSRLSPENRGKLAKHLRVNPLTIPND